MSCPGFLPQPTRLTRCRRCFREYVDHRSLLNGDRRRSEGGGTERGSRTRKSSSSSDDGSGNDDDSIYANVQIAPRRRRCRSEPEDCSQTTVVRRSRFLHIEGVKDTSNRAPRVRPRSFTSSNGDGAPPIPARDEPQAPPPPVPTDAKPPAPSGKSKISSSSASSETSSSESTPSPESKRKSSSFPENKAKLSNDVKVSQNEIMKSTKDNKPIESKIKSDDKKPNSPKLPEKKESTLASKEAASKHSMQQQSPKTAAQRKFSSEGSEEAKKSITKQNSLDLKSGLDSKKEEKKTLPDKIKREGSFDANKQRETEALTKSEGETKSPKFAINRREIDNKTTSYKTISGSKEDRSSEKTNESKKVELTKDKVSTKINISSKETIPKEEEKRTEDKINAEGKKAELQNAPKANAPFSSLSSDESKSKVASKFGPTLKDNKGVDSRKPSLAGEERKTSLLDRMPSKIKQEETKQKSESKEDKHLGAKATEKKDEGKHEIAKTTSKPEDKLKEKNHFGSEAKTPKKEEVQIDSKQDAKAENKLPTTLKSHDKEGDKLKKDVSLKSDSKKNEDQKELPKWCQELKARREEGKDELNKEEEKVGPSRRSSSRGSLGDIKSRFEQKSADTKVIEDLKKDKNKEEAKVNLDRRPSLKGSLTDIKSKFDQKPIDSKSPEPIKVQDKSNTNVSTGKMVGGIRTNEKVDEETKRVFSKSDVELGKKADDIPGKTLKESGLKDPSSKKSPEEKPQETASRPSPSPTRLEDEKKKKRDGEVPSVEAEFKIKLKSPRVDRKDESESARKQEEKLLENQKKIGELENAISDLKRQLEKAEEKCRYLEKEKNDIVKERCKKEKEEKSALEKTASEILKLRTRLHELEATNDELKDENKALKREVREVKAEVSRRESPDQVRHTVETLTSKLRQAEALCEELQEENDEIKREVKNLETELEELHDHFREDQASEFRDLKRDMEALSKQCRVLTFKLKKAEKRSEQLESEREDLENQLRDLRNATRAEPQDQARLQHELSVANELCSKVTEELEATKEIARQLEAEKESLKKQLFGGKASPIEQQLSPSLPLPKDAGFKSTEELMRELYDTMERETDLREQLKFAEDEARAARRKLSTLEQENETLVLQMKKLASGRTHRLTSESSSEEEDDLSAEDLRLQLDLTEQEMIVLRKKLEDLEQSNENLESEVKYLQNKLINQPVTSFDVPELPPLDPSNPNVYYEHKIKLLEYEAKELRKKLVDKEKDNERLQTEVEVHRRKAFKVIVRSRSLDSELQVDLKRQLQLVEQEASILRQKVTDLENENEKIATENKRYQLRLSRKPPPGPADILQLENMELKLKNEDLARKVEAMREQLEKGPSAATTTVIQEYKPKREITDAENELIVALKKRIKEKEDENLSLQTKISQLEVESNRMNREFKKLKDALNIKKKPPKLVRDSATRMELREIVSDLQDEICELQVTLRGRECVQETMEEEIAALRREVENARSETRARENDLERLKAQCESVRQESLAERERTETARRQLENAAKERGTSVDLLEKVDTLQNQRNKLETRLKEAEASLAKEHLRVQQLQDQLSAASSIRDDLATANKLLETQRQDANKELEHLKKSLKTAEDQIKGLSAKLEETEKEMALHKAECAQLRAELEQEKKKSVGESRQISEAAAGWLKERDDLKRQILDLKGRSDTLQIQMGYNEKAHREKEAKLKEEYERKLEDLADRKKKLENELELVKTHEKESRNKLSQTTETIEKLEESVRELQEKHRTVVAQLRKEKEDWAAREEDLEARLRAEIKRYERAEREHEQATRARDEELLASRDRVVALEREVRRLQGAVAGAEAVEERVRAQERDLTAMRAERDELTARYEQLEAEFLSLKTRLVSEREEAEAKAAQLSEELTQAVSKTTLLKDKLAARQESWAKEKQALQGIIKELENKAEKLRNLEQERKRLKENLEEKDALLESYKREEKHLKEEREKLRRRMEDLGRKVAELERADRTARLNALAGRAAGGGDTAKEVADLKVRCEHAEKAHRAELAAVAAEYEGRLGLVSAEIGTMQDQIAALAKERDQLRSQLESKGSSEGEETISPETVAKLKEEVEDLREQLDDARLEHKNLQLQYDTDHSTWEISACDLRSKINQLEEQKVLETARSSRGYAKTRLELAWDKERAEQQRALTEAQALICQLRDQLRAAETERHRLHKMAKSSSQQDLRQVSEMRSNLLATRESQERLQVQVEGLRKDRERMVLERNAWRQRLKSSQDLHVKVTDVLDEVHKLASALQVHADRVGQKDIETILERVKNHMDQLKKTAAPVKDESSLYANFRRSISASDMADSQQGDPATRWMNPQRVTNYPLPPPSMLIRAPPRAKTLHRKSLSLDQSMAARSQDLLKIWDSGTESNVTSPMGSQLSLSRYDSDTSADSMATTGGGHHPMPPRGLRTLPVRPDRYRDLESEEAGDARARQLAPTQVKSRKSLKEKLKMFRKTKSIDTGASNWSSPKEGSLDREEKERTLRSKISNVLKKPLIKSSSVDDPAANQSKSRPETPSGQKSLLGRLNPERWAKTKTDSTLASKKPS